MNTRFPMQLDDCRQETIHCMNTEPRILDNSSSLMLQDLQLDWLSDLKTHILGWEKAGGSATFLVASFNLEVVGVKNRSGFRDGFWTTCLTPRLRFCEICSARECVCEVKVDKEWITKDAEWLLFVGTEIPSLIASREDIKSLTSSWDSDLKKWLNSTPGLLECNMALWRQTVLQPTKQCFHLIIQHRKSLSAYREWRQGCRRMWKHVVLILLSRDIIQCIIFMANSRGTLKISFQETSLTRRYL